MKFDLAYRTVISLLLGLYASCYLLQEDPYINFIIQEKLISLFENSFDCKVKAHLKEFNILRATLEGEDIVVTSQDKKSWWWSASKVKVSFSWPYLILRRKIGLSISFFNLKSYSTMKLNQIAIAAHIKKIANETNNLPITLQALTINNGYITCFDPATNITLSSGISLHARPSPERFKAALYLGSGKITHKERIVAHDIHGTVTFEKKVDNEKQITISYTLDGGGILGDDNDPYQEFRIFIKKNNDTVKANIETKDRSSFVDIEIINKSSPLNCKMQCHIPLIILNKISNIFTTKNVDGMCDINMHIDPISYDLSASILFSNVKYQNNFVGTTLIDIFQTSGLWHCTFKNSNADLGKLRGEMILNSKTGNIKFECHNKGEVILFNSKHWKMMPNEFDIHFSYNYFTKTGRGEYGAAVSHQKIKTVINTKGSLLFDKNNLSIQGNLNQKKYAATIQLDKPILTQLIYTDENDNQLLTARSNNEGNKIILNAEIKYTLIRSIMSKLFNVDPSGEGTISLTAFLQENVIKGTFFLQKSNIRLLPTHNFIKDFSGSFNCNLHTWSLILENMKCILHKGSINCKRCKLNLDNESNLYLHLPLVLNGLFLNVEKDLYATVSGPLTITKKAKFFAQGHLFIDKGQLCRNLFSTLMQQNIAQSLGNSLLNSTADAICDLVLETKKPLRIKTPFLHTDATLNMRINGTTQNPRITGKIALSVGSLAFPYKPLYITHGMLYFLPNQLHDPVIELTAKGKIKKYHITLRAFGSIQHPHVTFESSPPLKEEQILTLLFTGSEKGSFALAMPSLVMQNVQNILFGPDSSASKLESYVKNIFKPLHYIRIVPGFNDLSGRGGFRGAIEIEVNDQFHALIQKNFSLPEDTRFEVEYDILEDISIRGIKDERGDLGGEIEMRWKF